MPLHQFPKWFRFLLPVVTVAAAVLLGVGIARSAPASPPSNYHQTANGPALYKPDVEKVAKRYVEKSKLGSKLHVSNVKLTAKYKGFAVIYYDRGIYRVKIQVFVVKNSKTGNVRVAGYRILEKREKYPGEDRSVLL